MLEVKDLESGYGNMKILTGVNLEVKDGEIVAVIGRNGVGKSTLLKTLIGSLKTMSGNISLDGISIEKQQPYVRAREGIGYVPQGHMLFPDLTVEENLTMGRNINKKIKIEPQYDLVYEYFPRLYERKKQKAGTMSGGEQAMLSMGRVLMGLPKIMLLDEPSEGVQPNIVEQIGIIVNRINKELNTTVLIVEQNYKLIQMTAQRGYAIDKGRIVDSLTGEDIREYSKIKTYLTV